MAGARPGSRQAGFRQDQASSCHGIGVVDRRARVLVVTEFPGGGRQLTAKYAFRGATAALERTVPLAPNEQVLFHGVLRLRGQGPLPRPMFLRLTGPRLVLLAHFAMRPDVVWELPRTAVQAVELTDKRVRISWIDGHAEQQITQLARWDRRRIALDHRVRDVHVAADVLSRWLAGDELEGFTTPRSHEAH